MLTQLHIENIAVIEKADIEFRKGLTVLTGETGAGKSIIVDSLGAVLGARTSRELVRTGADKGVVTAVFETNNADKWLEDNDIDLEDEIIIQRRISAEGKTAAVCAVLLCPCRSCASSVRCFWISTAKTTADSSWTRQITLRISTATAITARLSTDLSPLTPIIRRAKGDTASFNGRD